MLQLLRFIIVRSFRYITTIRKERILQWTLCKQTSPDTFPHLPSKNSKSSVPSSVNHFHMVR